MPITIETNKGYRTPFGINGHDCRGCANWNGSCCYDMNTEAKAEKCSVSDIVNKERCLYRERKHN